MRLYCQQGFSSRIVQALRIRLERTLRMAAEEGHGHGGSSRIRSRSRGRGAEADAANLGPETSTVLDSTGAGMGDVAGPPAGAEVGDGTVPLADGSVPPGGTMPEGTPGDVNAPFPPVPPVITPPGDVNAAEVLAVSTELARKISECSNRLANVSEELAITMEHFTQGRVEMKKGFGELSVQIQNQATCITTMTSGVSFQAGETTKLLKAFDRWAATGRWALTGNQSVEANIQGVKSEVEKQTKKLETNLSLGFDSIGRHLREMVRLLEERAQNAAAPAAVGGTGTPITPGGISTSGINTAHGWKSGRINNPRACRGRCRNSSHTRNGQCPWNYWACWDCKSGRINITRTCPCPSSSTTSGRASVNLYGVLSGTAERAETKYSPSDPNTVPACGHRYQRCGNGCTEDIVTDGIPS